MRLHGGPSGEKPGRERDGAVSVQGLGAWAPSCFAVGPGALGPDTIALPGYWPERTRCSGSWRGPIRIGVRSARRPKRRRRERELHDGALTKET